MRLAGVIRFDRLVAAPNLTPLVGVLLALFAGTAGLAGAAEPTTSLELPPAAYMNCHPLRQSVQLVVEADGAYRLDGRVVGRNGLDAALAKLAAAEQRLAVRAGPDVAYGSIRPLVEAAGRAGVGVDLVRERSS